jgi:hypothetical protein
MTATEDKMLVAQLQDQVKDLQAEVELWKAKHRAVESIAFELTAALKRLGGEENEPPW